MASSILDKSLDELSRQQERHRGRGRGGGRQSLGRNNSGAGRNSPYTKPAIAPAAAQGDVDNPWQHDLFKTDKLDYGGEGEGDQQAGRETGRRVGARSHTNEARSTRLRITNLHYEVSERELEALFVQIGPLASGTAKESNPAIKFDSSGRSMGEATVTYESEGDAAKAKDTFDNALAKGERISIAYDFSAPRKPRQKADDSWKSAQLGGAGTGTLLSRLGKSSEPTVSTQAPAVNFMSERASAPSRGRGSVRGASRGSAPTTRGGGVSNAGRGGRGGRQPREDRSRGAKTQEDLDKELDDFMNAGSATNSAPAGDVEMS